MKTATRAALAATLIGLALPLHAEEFLDKRPYISPMFAYTFDEKDRGSEEGLGWYFGGGKALNKYWNAELGSFYSRFNDKNGATGALWRELGVKLDGQFFYSREKAFSPYFGIGAGVQQTDLLGTGVKDTQPIVDTGLGFISWFDIITECQFKPFFDFIAKSCHSQGKVDKRHGKAWSFIVLFDVLHRVALVRY